VGRAEIGELDGSHVTRVTGDMAGLSGTVSGSASQAPEHTAAPDQTRAALAARINTVEEWYELMLAYAAQGLTTDAGGAFGSQVREHLRRCDTALTGLSDQLSEFVALSAAQPVEAYQAFIHVIDRDARSAQAAVQLVLAQPSISSQLVDNLNASIHVRALLTDLFLIDEILKTTSHR
jgi:hypothetical protein